MASVTRWLSARSYSGFYYYKQSSHQRGLLFSALTKGRLKLIVVIFVFFLQGCDVIDHVFAHEEGLVSRYSQCDDSSGVFEINLHHNEQSQGELIVSISNRLYQKSFSGSETIHLCTPNNVIERLEVRWDKHHVSTLEFLDLQLDKVTFYYPNHFESMGTKILQSKQKVLDYFSNVELDVNGLLGMGRLTEMYNLPESFDKDYLSLYNAMKANQPPLMLSRMNMYQRILDPGQDEFANEILSDEELKRVPVMLQNIDAFTMPALFCRARPMAEDIFKEWERLAVHGGGHGKTHALLAYRWAQENGCDLSHVSRGFVDRMLVKLFSLVESDDGWDDGEVEVLTWSVWFDRSFLLPPEFLQSLIDNQMQDGGWRADSRLNISNQHTSILALWLFLDLESGGKRKATFAAQPNASID